MTDREAQLEGQVKALESALAHWRRESDRDAGKIARLEKEAHAFRIGACWAYQLAGAASAPVEALDNLSALANGVKPPHEWPYPAMPDGLLFQLMDAKREWSERVFGADFPVSRIVAHIRKECEEILADPSDTSEPVDVILLAMDLYWRAGGADLLADLWAKHRVNQARQWRTGGDGVVEHVREDAR